jgi:hypothetical protein
MGIRGLARSRVGALLKEVVLELRDQFRRCNTSGHVDRSIIGGIIARKVTSIHDQVKFSDTEIGECLPSDLAVLCLQVVQARLVRYGDCNPGCAPVDLPSVIEPVRKRNLPICWRILLSPSPSHTVGLP